MLISKEGFAFGEGVWKLYNVANDPGETTDLSADDPEIFEELKSAWDKYAADVGVVQSSQ